MPRPALRMCVICSAFAIDIIKRWRREAQGPPFNHKQKRRGLSLGALRIVYSIFAYCSAFSSPYSLTAFSLRITRFSLSLSGRVMNRASSFTGDHIG